MEQSLLHEAAEHNKVKSMETLMELGANVNAHDKVSQAPPFSPSLSLPVSLLPTNCHPPFERTH